MAQDIHVTQQNLPQFQDYLLNMQQPEFSPNLHFDLPLSVILRNAPTLSPAAQETLAYVIAIGHGHENRQADAETMINLAEKQPILLGRVYQRSGNSTAYTGNIFNNIVQTLEHRPFEQNIPAIYTLLHYGEVFRPGTGEVGKTSAQNTRYLNEIFRASREYGNDQFHDSARQFMREMPTYQLLNFETKEPGFREFIDQQNFGNYKYSDKRIDMLKRIDPDKITEATLATMIKLARPEKKDTTNAKTQAEKNANILPMYYMKVRDALLRLVEKQEIHDRNNHGALKTLSQRYKEVTTKLLGLSWEDINKYYTKQSLIMDTYLMTLQRDVIDGNAEKLSPAELQIVLDNDKTGFYIRKIDRKLLNQTKVRLTEKQNAIFAAQDENNTQYAIKNKHLSSRDKREALNRLEKSIAADAPARDALNAELSKYDQDYRVVADHEQAYANVSKAWAAIQQVQKAYDQITRNFKDGKPNDREASLDSRVMEDRIYNHITGANREYISMPDEGGLPIFGRSKEKDRREYMAHAVNDLNDALSQIARGMNPEALEIISKYKGDILKPETLSTVEGMMNTAGHTSNNAHSRFISTHRDRGTIEWDLRKFSNKQQKLEDAKTEFNAQQSRMREMSKRHMGRDQAGELTPVTDDMTPEEKRAMRQKNRNVLKDALGARKNKKPAHNLEEMLQNADMDR